MDFALLQTVEASRITGTPRPLNGTLMFKDPRAIHLLDGGMPKQHEAGLRDLSVEMQETRVKTI